MKTLMNIASSPQRGDGIVISAQLTLDAEERLSDAIGVLACALAGHLAAGDEVRRDHVGLGARSGGVGGVRRDGALRAVAVVELEEDSRVRVGRDGGSDKLRERRGGCRAEQGDDRECEEGDDGRGFHPGDEKS